MASEHRDTSGPEHDYGALCEVEPDLLDLETAVSAYAEINQASQASHCAHSFYMDWLYDRLGSVCKARPRAGRIWHATP